MSFYGIYLGWGDIVEIFATNLEEAIKNFNDAEFYYSDQEPHKLQYTFYKFDKSMHKYLDNSMRIYVDKSLMEFIVI
ncbi:MAG: hypothetical protein JHC33_02005 [Ignisphaera sp.]|jgi:hypothetical protein|nr:hypothetical protein [Ignisphaera sp.]